MKDFAKVIATYQARQNVISTNEGVYFQSYDSVCAKVTSEGLTLGRDWDFSKTTLKHLYNFLRDYKYNVWCMVEGSSNKKATIQKLINENKIAYDVEMR